MKVKQQNQDINIDKENLPKILEVLFFQTTRARNLICLENIFSWLLNIKFHSFDNIKYKWYYYAYDCIRDEAISICIRLFSSYEKEYSITKILNKLHKRNSKLFVDIFNIEKSILDDLFKDYNKLKENRKRLIDRRNSFAMHFDIDMFDDNYNEKYKIYYNDIIVLLDFANKTLKKLYALLTNERLKEYDLSSFRDLYTFINLLDENGNLKEPS